MPQHPTLRQTHRWLVGFTLLGLGASAASTYVHYRLSVDPAYASFCDMSRLFSCAGAYTSPYASVAGVPVAVIGMIWFAGVAGLVWAGRPDMRRVPPDVAAGVRDETAAAPGAEPTEQREMSPAGLAAHLPAYLFVLSLPALAVVMFYAYTSFAVLRTVCVLCALTYVSVLGLFLTSSRSRTLSPRAVSKRLQADLLDLVHRPRALTAALGALALAVATLLFVPRVPATSVVAGNANVPESAESIEEFLDWFAQQPRLNLVVSASSAPVVIVKFNDYECPSCAATHFAHKPILDRYESSAPDDVDFFTVDFPLSTDCNDAIAGTVHPAACVGAVAVRLAREAGQATPMADWLYAHQVGMTAERVERAAAEIAGVTNFDEGYERLLPLIRQDAEVGGRLAIRGTPTFFVNGVRIEGGLSPDRLDAVIAYELRRTLTEEDDRVPELTSADAQ